MTAVLIIGGLGVLAVAVLALAWALSPHGTHTTRRQRGARLSRCAGALRRACRLPRGRLTARTQALDQWWLIMLRRMNAEQAAEVDDGYVELLAGETCRHGWPGST